MTEQDFQRRMDVMIKHVLNKKIDGQELIGREDLHLTLSEAYRAMLSRKFLPESYAPVSSYGSEGQVIG